MLDKKEIAFAILLVIAFAILYWFPCIILGVIYLINICLGG